MKIRIINIQVIQEFKIRVFLNNGDNFIFDAHDFVTYPCNKELQEEMTFNKVKYKPTFLYWDDDHDIHLDQIIPNVYSANDIY
jgi:hypothetical protein